MNQKMRNLLLMQLGKAQNRMNKRRKKDDPLDEHRAPTNETCIHVKELYQITLLQ